MKGWFVLLFMLMVVFPFSAKTQTVNISDYDRDDTRDMNFEIIGKMNDQILIYKNIRTKHKICIYDRDMNRVETVKLDFIPERTFNIDFVAYANYFFMVYQYQKGNIIYCMSVKMDAKAQQLMEPLQLDTTRIPVMTNNKIYNTIFSEDRKKIIIFKVQSRNQKFNLQSMLFDSDMKLISKNRMFTDYNDQRETYDNFLVANDGNFIFTYSKQAGNREYSNTLSLVVKEPNNDAFTFREINLEEKYIDDVYLKIDNRNNRYLINSFYYKKSRGSIEGLFTYIWDKPAEKVMGLQFTEIYDSLRAEAKADGKLRFALDNFFIKQVVVKADGGFILAAEDFTKDTRDNNTFNRFDYFYNPYSFSSGYYYYNPYTGYYRPWNRISNQSTRYYYENILILNINKTGQLVWSRVIQKSQFDDEDENFLSFSTVRSGSAIHFLFNNDKKYQVIADQSLSSDGTITRNPTLKSPQKGYQFMPSLSKQTGSNQIIIPCAYRNFICFAKVDF